MVNVMITGSKYTEDSGHCWFYTALTVENIISRISNGSISEDATGICRKIG